MLSNSSRRIVEPIEDSSKCAIDAGRAAAFDAASLWLYSIVLIMVFFVDESQFVSETQIPHLSYIIQHVRHETEFP